jgi:hypothetical protein
MEALKQASRAVLLFKERVVAQPLIPVLLLVITVASAADSSLLETFVPVANGSLSVECVCATHPGGAEQCLLGGVADAPAARQTNWSLTVHGQTGHKIDLAAACYRKRDQAPLLCCDGDDEQSSRHWFRARVPH